jgi:hypothetical protein
MSRLAAEGWLERHKVRRDSFIGWSRREGKLPMPPHK